MQGPDAPSNPYKAPGDAGGQGPPESVLAAGLGLLALEALALVTGGGCAAMVGGPITGATVSCGLGAFAWGWYNASSRLSRPLVAAGTHWLLGVAIVGGAVWVGRSVTTAVVIAALLLVVAVLGGEWGAQTGTTRSAQRRTPDPNAPTLAHDDPLQRIMGGNRPLPVMPDPDPYEPSLDDPKVIVVEPSKPPEPAVSSATRRSS